MWRPASAGRHRFPSSLVATMNRRRRVDDNRKRKDSGETLIVHLGMSGSFEITRRRGTRSVPPADPHDHVVFELSSGAIVTCSAS